MRTSSRSKALSRLRELREEQGFSQYGLAQESGVGRSTIAALETAQRGAHPSTMRSLARALGVRVPELYTNRISPPPPPPPPPPAWQDRTAQRAQSYEGLREKLREAFPGIEYEADLERMAEQFVVELGWLQERSYPLELTPAPSARLSANSLLELAESFYRFRMERWRRGEAAAGHVGAFEAVELSPESDGLSRA
jgi:transcriptional regulator with XRE-family HTH domain